MRLQQVQWQVFLHLSTNTWPTMHNFDSSSAPWYLLITITRMGLHSQITETEDKPTQLIAVLLKQIHFPSYQLGVQ